jgi:putative ABC transport system substrate-binding protein
MKRREFIALLGGAAAAWPIAARAQQGERVRRIGILTSQPFPPFQRFARKLREYGYIDGQNLRFVSRFATIPIVMGAIGDPVSVGIVSNLARPNGNITGFAAQNVDLEGKRLDLLKDLLPHLSRVGMLTNTTNPLLEVSLQKLRPAAEQLRVMLDLFDIRSSDEIEGALLRLNQTRPDGVLVAPDLVLLTHRSEIAAALAQSKLPAVYPFREYAGVGGLMIHGADLGVLSERAAGYVDRILKGANPADLPVQLATEFELIINLRTASMIGLTVPPTLIARADEVIE